MEPSRVVNSAVLKESLSDHDVASTAIRVNSAQDMNK
jgi:hypothetical protein